MSEKSKTRIEIISELLTQQMNHWLLFSVALIVMGGTSEYINITKPDVLVWFCCGFLPVLTFLIRYKVPKFLPFTICNLALLGLCFIFPAETIVSRVLCVACGVGYFIHTYSLRLKADSFYSSPITPVVGVGAAVFGIIFLGYTTSVNWDIYFAIPLILCFAMYLIIYYINHYLSFLTVNESSSGSIPSSEIFHSGMGLVAGYTILGTVILLLTMNLAWMTPILNAVKGVMFAVFRFLFSLFPDDSTSEEILVGESIPQTDNGGMMLPEGESALFWEIMEVICIIAFFVLMVYALAKLIFRIVKFLRERFQHNFRRKNWGADVGFSQDIREKCDLVKDSSEKKEHHLFDFLSPGERIRKLYKKRLLSMAIPLVKGETEKLALFTARDSEQKLGTNGMADVYEKVRYSGENASAEDVRRMKDACRS